MTTKLFFLIAVIPLLLVLAPSLSMMAYAYTVWNVNLNRTVILPIKTPYPSTTITDNGSCGYDAFIAIKNVQKEKTQNPAMFKSDAFTSIQLPENSTKYYWCGIAK